MADRFLVYTVDRGAKSPRAVPEMLGGKEEAEAYLRGFPPKERKRFKILKTFQTEIKHGHLPEKDLEEHYAHKFTFPFTK